VPTGPQTVEISTGGIPTTENFVVTRENYKEILKNKCENDYQDDITNDYTNIY
jgi:hypothetical protein